MERLRKFGSAAIVAALISIGMFVGAARVEAAGKKGGGDGESATCSYLLNIINYPYASPYIKAYAISLYTSLGCQPAL